MKIGEDFPCYIVAEIGLNHNGDVEFGKKIIAAAKEAGADAVKFQAYVAEKLVSESTNKKMFEFMKPYELSESQFVELKKTADSLGIDFFASAFDAGSADMLQRMDIPCFKVASGELTNLPLLKHIASKKKPVILSIGFASMGEIQAALKALKGVKVILLHCVAEYPAQLNRLNLKKIPLLKKEFSVTVGFSDHSQGIVAPLAAVALGAKVIEKHFTIHKNLAGADHMMSTDPIEFEQMVKGIRDVEKTLAKSKSFIAENNERRIECRKGLYAAEEISPNETIAENKIVLLRPAIGIKPKEFYKVVGKKAKVRIAKGEVLTWSKIQK